MQVVQLYPMLDAKRRRKIPRKQITLFEPNHLYVWWFVSVDNAVNGPVGARQLLCQYMRGNVVKVQGRGISEEHREPLDSQWLRIDCSAVVKMLGRVPRAASQHLDDLCRAVSQDARVTASAVGVVGATAATPTAAPAATQGEVAGAAGVVGAAAAPTPGAEKLQIKTVVVSILSLRHV